MLSFEQAAKQPGISSALVYILVSERMLPHYRVGRPGRRGNMRIAEADLAAFMERRKTVPEMRKTPQAVKPAARKKSSNTFRGSEI
ncbi:MAG TPA: helix-turn-helix domain-containing protein [Gemmataceae bacterium]|nr:helix-turn-helix domain-containing protein [Gemmataceae bacterium]